jgi:excisionase family DNA binding protein
MREFEGDLRYERRHHQDDDSWSNGRPDRERRFNRIALYREPAATNDQTLLISVEEAAHLLGVGRTTMFELVGRGDVKSVRLGRRRLIARKSLESFVESLSSQ